MRSRNLVVFVSSAAAVWVFAQQPPPKTTGEEQGARQLYYFANPKKEQLPPIPKEPPKTPSTRTSAAPSPAAAVHLGLSYTVALWHDKEQRMEPVDPDRMFRKGECFVLKINANRSGYLYVLAKGSSGNWQPMLPSPHMPEENNIIDPGQKVRIPASYCFEIADPPGTETLTVMLSRDPRDIFELHDSIRSAPDAPAAAPGRVADGQQSASARITKEVERMNRQFGTRDLIFHKTEKPQDPAREDPYSVYVVNGSDKPSSMVLATIRIQHR